jgi:hypothetical protein
MEKGASNPENDFENEFQFQLLQDSLPLRQRQRAESRAVVICITRGGTRLELAS